jgi:hypothetical protein
MKALLPTYLLGAGFLLAGVGGLVWTVANVIDAWRLHRRLYPRGLRLVVGARTSRKDASHVTTR